MPTLSGARIAIVDTESTGLKYAEGHRLVEVAVRYRGSGVDEWSTLVNPMRTIPPDASGIHHLTDRHVAGAPLVTEIADELQAVLSPAEVIVAHNAEHDRQFLDPLIGERPWICSYRLAQHLWPDAPNHKLQTLRYWLDETRGDDLGSSLGLHGLDPHRAMADVIVLEYVLGAAIDEYLAQGHEDDLAAAIAFAASPIFVKRMPFGKYRDVAIDNIVDYDYLVFMLGTRNTAELRPDLRATLERRLVAIVESTLSTEVVRAIGGHRDVTDAVRAVCRARWSAIFAEIHAKGSAA